MALRAGNLRERVEIQANTPTTNARGQELPSWATVAIRWARVTPDSGSEATAADKRTARRRFTVTVRLYPVTPAHRLRWRGLSLSVNSVLPSEDRSASVLSCTEVAA